MMTRDLTGENRYMALAYCRGCGMVVACEAERDDEEFYEMSSPYHFDGPADCTSDKFPTAPFLIVWDRRTGKVVSK